MPDNSSAIFRRRDYVRITLFGFAVTALWQSLHTIILPIRLLDFVPEAQKNTYLGLLTLFGLLLAMLYQPVIGAVSDRSALAPGEASPVYPYRRSHHRAPYPGHRAGGRFRRPVRRLLPAPVRQ